MEITKDFIKFLAEVIVTLMIFSVVFGEEGIASNTYNYMAYAEHIIMQDYLSTAFTVGSQAPGEFSASIKTSGQPYTIKVYNENGQDYVYVEPKGEVYLRTKYARIEPVPIITDCKVMQTELKISESLIQTLVVRKNIQEGICVLSLTGEGD